MKTQITETISARTYGIEIEMYAKQPMSNVKLHLQSAGVNMERNGWKIVGDGSLHNITGYFSMEIVSPILSGSEGIEQIRKVCSVLNSSPIDAIVNKKCGLHVHHDASDYNDKQMRNIFDLYKNYETEIDELVAPSRRANNAYYCQGFQYVNFDSLYGRYWKVNLSAYYRHGTVEIRHFNGTTDADKICGWVVFTQAIVERSATATKKIKKAKNMLSGIHLYTHKTNEFLLNKTESEVSRIENLLKSIRGWVKERKAVLAS